jgi:glycosyltransferase involved in cell wall biosynthesis
MENSPVVVHEALAAGRPVLGTTRGGVGELVEDGKQGILFDPLDRAAFAAALARWAGLEAGARTTMALAARDRAAAGGGPSGWLPRLVEEYHRTIHDAGVRRAP